MRNNFTSTIQTLFPGFDQHVEVNQQLIELYYAKIQQFFKKYKDLFLAFCIDLYAKEQYKQFPAEIKNDIQLLFQNEQNHLSFFQNLIPLESFQSKFFIEFIKSAKELVIPRKGVQYDNVILTAKSLLHGVDPEKAVQTFKLYEYVKSKVGNKKQTFIDLGAGKGYLSSYLAFDCNQEVVAIEGSEKHAISLAKRNADLCLRQFPGVFKAIVGKDCAEEDLKLFSNFRIGIQFVDTTTDPIMLKSKALNLKQFHEAYSERDVKQQEHRVHSMIQGQAAPLVSESLNNLSINLQNSEQFTILGLHACGDLSVIALKMLNQKNIQNVFTVPCCYQHLSDNGFPLSGETLTTIKLLESDFCQVSQNITSVKLPRQLLNYAAMGFDQQVEKDLRQVDYLHNRAILECCRNNAGLFNNTTIKEKTDISSNEELQNWILQQIRKESKLIQIEFINQTIKEFENYKWTMQAHCVVRQVFGQVFESLILVDRLLYLRRQNILKSQIDWCLGGLSGRGFVLWGGKE